MCLTKWNHKWEQWFHEGSYPGDLMRGFYRHCVKCGHTQYLLVSWGGHDWTDMDDEEDTKLLRSLTIPLMETV